MSSSAPVSPVNRLPGESQEPRSEASYLTASRGIRSWLFTLDHKRIGVMYLISVLLAFLAFPSSRWSRCSLSFRWSRWSRWSRRSR